MLLRILDTVGVASAVVAVVALVFFELSRLRLRRAPLARTVIVWSTAVLAVCVVLRLASLIR